MEQEQTSCSSNSIRNWLVVGDGDLSYSASIASTLAEKGIRLTATVWEDEETHNEIYQNSRHHTRAVMQSHDLHRVLFGVDATDLSSRFSAEESFDRIDFNFPHWKGKMNHRRNRQLVNSFLESASQVLSPAGEVHIPLCQGQGGMTASSADEWKRSWMIAMYAADHGFLLCRLEVYRPEYDLSSHRGRDRPFAIGEVPKRYVFRRPNGRPIDSHLQICCRHELRILIPSNERQNWSKIIDGDAILQLAEGLAPTGIRVHVPWREFAEYQGNILAAFLMVYCGQSNPLTRTGADEIRAKLEIAAQESFGLQVAKRGRLVSKPFPYPILDRLIDDYLATSYNQVESTDNRSA